MRKHRFNKKYFAKRKQERSELDRKLRSVAYQFSTYGNIFFVVKHCMSWIGMVEGNRGFLVPTGAKEMYLRDILKMMERYFESNHIEEKETCRGA